MAKTHQRVVALVAAIVFLTSSLAFSGYVIWQLATQNDTQSPADSAQIKGQSKEVQENMLQGTKLENFSPISQVETLQVVDIKEGDGEVVKEGAKVTAHYTGALSKDGTIFQSSKDMGQPIAFSLAGVIEGWQKGVPGMKVGGIRRLIIPAAMAYGEAGSPPTIGPNEPLVFDIELFAVEQ